MAQEFAVGVDDAGVALLAGCSLLSLNLNACQKCAAAAAAAGPPCYYIRSHTCKLSLLRDRPRQGILGLP